MSWRQAFADQARACAALGSPFAALLLAGFAERGLPEGPVAARIATWPGNIGSSGASVPLRLAGALHGLVLEARAPELAALFPGSGAAPEDAALWAVACRAIETHAGWIANRLGHAPQTNEVARAAALIAAANLLTAERRLPIVLSELGASAGLNLLFDRYALKTPEATLGPADPVLTLAPEWRALCPSSAPPVIAARAGVDLSPCDPVADQLRLLSYVWPDQPARLARTQAALTEAARLRPRVDMADAIDWLETRLATAHPGYLHLVFHTVAWQYFPADAKARGEALLAAAGARATATAPIARFAMEADGAAPGAALTLTLWPGGAPRALGRFDFHGRWIDWRA